MKTGFCIWLSCWLLWSCELFDSGAPPVCNPIGIKPVIKVIFTQPASDCLLPDGAITVSAITGKPPFRYFLEEQSSLDGVFKKLHAGEYKIRVLDASNCDGFLTVTVPATGLVMTAVASSTPNNSCFSNSGTITLKIFNGKRPFRYQLDDRPFQVDSIFYSLDEGIYKLVVQDGANCRYQLFARVFHGNTGVSYNKDVHPILLRSCIVPGCHNGDAGSTINFTQFNIVKAYGSILIRYASMYHRQPPLSKQEIDYIRCWVEDGTPNN